MIDEITEELKSTLELLVKEDINISYRNVLSKMTSLSSPSAISRNEDRKALVDNAKKKQAEARKIASKIVKSSTKSDKTRIVKLEQEVNELQSHNKILEANLIALIKAASMQGVNWQKFSKDYDLHASVNLLKLKSVDTDES